MKIGPNLNFLYLEVPLLDRFKAAARDGFHEVELTFPYVESIEDLRTAADDANITIVEFNLPAGELIPGVQRGVAAVPGRNAEFQEQVEEGLEYAIGLGCKRLLTLAGIVPPGGDRSGAEHVFVQNLRMAADICARHDITLLIETNNRRDFPNYLLETIADARAIVERVHRPNLKIVFDFYHVQLNEGDVLTRFKNALDIIGHVQFASPPHRYEPGNGDLDFEFIFKQMNEMGFNGFVGAEYFSSTGDTQKALTWLRDKGYLPKPK